MATVLLSSRRCTLHGHPELKLWLFREAFGSPHIASSAYQTWPTSACTHFRIRSLRVGAESIDPNSLQSVSSTARNVDCTSLHCYPEGNFGRNQLLDGSIGLSPLYPGAAIDLHVRTADGFHQRFLLASPSPGIVHHLSGLTLHARIMLNIKKRLGVLMPIDSHARESPWSVLQDGCYVRTLSTTVNKVDWGSQMMQTGFPLSFHESYT